MNFQNIVRYFASDEISDFLVEALAIILQIIAITLLFLFIKWLVNRFFEERFPKWLNRTAHMSRSRADTIADLSRNGIVYTMYFIYFYWLLTLLGVPIGTLIAGAGIAGIAIGFGAQEIIKDILNGFLIIFEGQYEIGDFISLPEEEITGTVISVGIRTTQLRSAAGEVYFIPNSTINIVNNQSRLVRKITIDLPTFDETPIELLESTIYETAKYIVDKYSDVVVGEPVIIGFVKNLDQMFNYRVEITVKNGEQYRHESLFYGEFLSAFEEKHIDIPNSVYDVQ